MLRVLIEFILFNHRSLQTVWRTTSRVGCAINYRDLYGGKMTFIVCQYKSGGNVGGLFLANIMKLRNGGRLEILVFFYAFNHISWLSLLNHTYHITTD